MKPLGIGIKILFGFLILTLMLVISGILSIYELYKIGSSVELMLEDNYKSINASEDMIEALEREDSGVLFLLMGRWQEGRAILHNADSLFMRNLRVASNNITIPGEKAYVDQLRSSYENYKSIWEKPIVGTSHEGDLNWYSDVVHRAFLSTKQDTESLMRLNDTVMYKISSDLKNRTHRTIMPGIISVLSAILFAIIFYYFVNYYFVKPILRINKGIISFLDNKKSYNVNIETNDEISMLNESVSNLCAYQKVK